MTEVDIESGIASGKFPFAEQMVIQLRAIDSYGTYDSWSDDKVIAPMILTKDRKREIPIIGDPDEVVISRLKAWYNAIATIIERQTGLMAVPLINLTHEGFGRAVIVVGKLVVLDKTLRDVHRFGFASVQKLCDDSVRIIDKAVTLINQFPEVARA